MFARILDLEEKINNERTVYYKGSRSLPGAAFATATTLDLLQSRLIRNNNLTVTSESCDLARSELWQLVLGNTSGYSSVPLGVMHEYR
jgi:hypothetical protein